MKILPLVTPLLGLAFLVPGFLGAMISSLMGGRAFENLVDLQFSNHHENWVASGKPAGGKLSRRETSFWSSGLSAPVVAWQWIFETPQWAKAEPAAAPLLRRMRLSYVWLFVSIMVVLFGMFFFGRAV